VRYLPFRTALVLLGNRPGGSLNLNARVWTSPGERQHRKSWYAQSACHPQSLWFSDTLHCSATESHNHSIGWVVPSG